MESRAGPIDGFRGSTSEFRVEEKVLRKKTSTDRGPADDAFVEEDSSIVGQRYIRTFADVGILYRQLLNLRQVNTRLFSHFETLRQRASRRLHILIVNSDLREANENFLPAKIRSL